MKTNNLTKLFYEAPSTETLEIVIETGLLYSQNSVRIEAMDVDDDELDW